jgi:hypothetical protein
MPRKTKVKAAKMYPYPKPQPPVAPKEFSSDKTLVKTFDPYDDEWFNHEDIPPNHQLHISHDKYQDTCDLYMNLYELKPEKNVHYDKQLFDYQKKLEEYKVALKQYNKDKVTYDTEQQRLKDERDAIEYKRLKTKFEVPSGSTL